MNDNLTNVFETEFKVLPVSTVNAVVKIEMSDLFDDAATTYSQEVDRVMRFISNPYYQITADEFLKYFTTLLYLRVMHVNGQKNKTTANYYADQRKYVVPTFIHVLLTSIGKATDRTQGITFKPAIEVDLDNLHSAEKMREISDKLDIINKEGLTCVETGVPINIEGDLQFMITLNLEHEILSYSKHHAIYGFYAAFFKHTLMCDVLEPKNLRIRYGVLNDYKSYLRQIV